MADNVDRRHLWPHNHGEFNWARSDSMRLFGRIVLILLAAVGTIFLLLGGLGVWFASKAGPEPLPKHMVLTLDMGDGLAETPPANPLARLGGKSPVAMLDLTRALDAAAHDERVGTVLFKFDDAKLGMAQAQELRDLIASFRKSGKRAVAYATAFGETGSGTVPYYAASAFSEIWMQPSGDLGLTGFMAQSPFFRELLDMVGVKPEFGARWEYKSAIESFTQRQFSKEAKSSIELLISSWSEQTVAGIAQSRGLTPDKVRAAIDRSPLLADEAKDAKLVDRLAYWDELETDLESGGAKMIELADYADRLRPADNAAKIALIYGVGTVQARGDDDNPLSEESVMAADRVTKAFRDAVKDKDIKAILFRIDSPGGSYTASDAIWREVGKARAAGKPVVVSMGNVAASGGYFAAMDADRIVALPGTVTGSIGVFTGKMVLADLWKKLGVNWDGVRYGQNAGIWSANEPFSDAGWERLNATLDRIYADFTGKAAKNRNIDIKAMDGIARGRIWPGDKAKEVGLVDKLGGLPVAMAEARELAKLAPDMPVDLVAFPKPKSLPQYVMDMARGHSAEALASLGAMGKLASVLKPFLEMTSAGKSELRMAPINTN